MATNLQLYESQVILFLQSATIIFSPMATQQNNNLLAAGIAVDETNPTTWRYYLNLSGQYHSSDTVMMIQSLDTKTLVEFTPAMLASSPRTQAAYVIGSSYYNALCQTYPTQIDLIKSILYPVDLETAINAADFTLLGWGEGYLESTEEEAIINEINAFLQYASNRWYFSWLSYECYYLWTFWASLWQTLPNVIFAARIKYLHTSYVHSFHIWSYLESNGIGDYSDILTRQQSLFLYRNINYLIENRGTQSNLVILVNNLLESISVGLVGKTIYMNTETNAALCEWVPEFVSTIVPTNNSQSLVIVPPESMTEINGELVAAGYEVNSDVDYVSEQQTFIGNTTLNILATKLVEIQKFGIDQKYGSILVNFILDTLVSMIVTGRYTPQLDIIDPTTNINISLDAKDSLALYYYAVQRSVQQQPVNLPILYTPSCAFRYDVTANSFPNTFSYDGSIYPTNSYVSISNMIDGITFPSLPFNEPEEFSSVVSNLFLVLIRNIQYSRTEGNHISLEMFLSYMYTYVLQRQSYTFSLSPYSDYITWAEAQDLTVLFSKLDADANYQTAYSNLATAISTALVPSDQSSVFAYYGYTPSSVDDIYDRLKTLFEQLCSYNIAFLDTSRVNIWWFLNERILTWINEITDTTPIAFNPVTGLPEISIGSQDNISLSPLDIEVSIQVTSSVLQNLVENDMITIGPESTVAPSAYMNSLNPTIQNQTDATTFLCTQSANPVFVSITTTP